MSMLGAGPSEVWVLLFGVGIGWATVRLKYTQISGVLK